MSRLREWLDWDPDLDMPYLVNTIFYIVSFLALIWAGAQGTDPLPV